MNRWEKELKTQGGRSIPERPILKKCCFKIPLQKVYWSNRNERWDPTPRVRHRPGPPVVPPPPRPIHGFANAEPEMVGPGAPFAKYFAGTVENFTGASLHRLYWVSVHVPLSLPFQLSLWYIQQYITLKKNEFQLGVRWVSVEKLLVLQKWLFGSHLTLHHK
jgi:hypothetical protein